MPPAFHSNSSQTSDAQISLAGQPDFGELVQRQEVADSLNALAHILGTSFQIDTPTGMELRFGDTTPVSVELLRRVCVGGQQVGLSFRDSSLTERRVEAACTVVKALLSMAYAVDDLADAAGYFNERLEQVLEIISKTETWNGIDVVVRELLRHLLGQFEIDRAFVVLETISSDGPRAWLAETSGDVYDEIVPLERWERLRGDACGGALDGTSTIWPPDSVPHSVTQIMKIADKSAALIITRLLGSSEHHIGLVGVRTLSAFRFGSIEAQWLDVILTTVAGTMATLAFHQADAARQQAVAAHRAVTNAVGMVAHKLHNPTSALLAQIGFCQEDIAAGRDIENFASLLREMRVCAERIQRVGHEFTELVVTPKLKRRRVDLATLVRKVVRSIVVPPYRLVFRQPPRHWQLVLDPILFRSILEEIVANAQRAMPKGGTIRVSFTGPHEAGQRPVTSMDQPYVTVAVTDEGPGVSPEKRDEIFEPFMTTRAEGTGLGLAIVREYAQILGGFVQVESRRPPACGARFRIALPVSDG